MAKSANPGEMTTRVRIYRPMKTVGADGRTGADLLLVTPPSGVHVKWVGAFGAEALQASQYGITEPATITMRYIPNVEPDCVIDKIAKAGWVRYEIVSINNVDDASAWLEIKVQREVAAI